jgi:hypothetical protein
VVTKYLATDKKLFQWQMQDRRKLLKSYLFYPEETDGLKRLERNFFLTLFDTSFGGTTLDGL